MRGLVLVATMAIALPHPAAALPQQQPDRVDQLVRSMTLEEKISMLHGATDPQGLSGAGYMPGVPRLGIPALRLGDGPAGVRTPNPATAMPAPIGLAATFDTARARRYGEVMGREARARNQDVLLAPMVNIVRVPNAGRNFETLGEDPLLAARIVGNEIRGVQSQGTIATVKHYAANNQENQRQSVSAGVDERTLHEIYLPGFEAAVKAGVGAVMCAYNRVNGTYACENPQLLTDILRTQFGFTGWVMSDWGATHSGPAALTAGLDMEMPGGNWFGAAMQTAATSGQVSAATIDQAVRRILTQMDRVGLLSSAVPPRPAIDIEADARIARDIAVAGAVLLKNERNTLPLRRADLGSVVLIGPTARAPLIGGGGSARVTPFRAQSPLVALALRGSGAARITYAPGIDLDGVAIPSSVLSPPNDPAAHGVQRAPSGAGAAGGAPGQPTGGASQIDPQIDFTGTQALPAGSAFTWTGVVTVPATGDYELKVQTAGGRATLQLDSAGAGGAGGGGGGRGGRGGGGRGGGLLSTGEGLSNTTTRATWTAGETHRITLTGTSGAGTPLQIRLAWIPPGWRQAKFDEAVAAARSARTAVVFAYNEGSEGSDRATLALAAEQDSLIAAITRANPRTAVVLNVGAPILMPWADQAGAILQMWYPGQEGADATAALLLGEANPGGKLPESFPRAPADAPTNTPERYPGVNGQQEYSEGVLVGYRWYDAKNVEPLFPFGHGLSYTTFQYSGLSVTPAGDGIDVRFTVKNSGTVAGAEVAQVYVGPPASAPVPMAPRNLAGFTRIELAPGAQQTLTVHVGARELSVWSVAQHAWTVVSGNRPVLVGSSSRDIRLRGSASVPAGRD